MGHMWDRRQERELEELEKTDPTSTTELLKQRSFVPKTIFERNVSPGLQKTT